MSKNTYIPQEKIQIIEANRKLKEQELKRKHDERVAVNNKLNDIKCGSDHFRITHVRRYRLNVSDIITVPTHVATALSNAGENVEILANGGLTVVEATFKMQDGKLRTVTGVSRCHKNDNFSRHGGRKYALANFEANNVKSLKSSKCPTESW